MLAWSEAMTLNTAKRDGAAWDDLRRLFNDAEIVEISLACAMFNMINRLNDSFRTELEPRNTTAASTARWASPPRRWRTTPAASAHNGMAVTRARYSLLGKSRNDERATVTH